MSYTEEKPRHWKDVETSVGEEPNGEHLHGWRLRMRKVEKALGIEAQGIKRVHESACIPHDRS